MKPSRSSKLTAELSYTSRSIAIAILNSADTRRPIFAAESPVTAILNLLMRIPPIAKQGTLRESFVRSVWRTATHHLVAARDADTKRLRPATQVPAVVLARCREFTFHRFRIADQGRLSSIRSARATVAPLVLSEAVLVLVIVIDAIRRWRFGNAFHMESQSRSHRQTTDGAREWNHFAPLSPKIRRKGVAI